MIQVDKMGRWEKTATTWTRKVCALLQREHGHAANGSERWLVGYSAQRVASDMLDDLDLLVPFLPEDLIEEVEAAATKLSRRLRDYRRAFQLEKTDGRAPEEAATFKAKAAELRGDN